MNRAEVVPRTDLEPAAWLQEQLVQFTGAVRDVVPTRFDGVVRILHRYDQGLGESGRWSEIADYCQTTLHPLVQFRMLAGLDARSMAARRWPEDVEPREGSLDRVTLSGLVEILGRYTATPHDCWFGLWAGWGGQPPQWHMAPTFCLPSREYHLFEGSLTDVDALSVEFECAGMEYDTGGRITISVPAERNDAESRARRADTWRSAGALQSPNLWWPDDRSWCVASEIDFDSTLVAGPAALLDAVIAMPEVEAFRVRPDDSLQLNADNVNMT